MNIACDVCKNIKMSSYKISCITFLSFSSVLLYQSTCHFCFPYLMIENLVFVFSGEEFFPLFAFCEYKEHQSDILKQLELLSHNIWNFKRISMNTFFLRYLWGRQTLFSAFKKFKFANFSLLYINTHLFICNEKQPAIFFKSYNLICGNKFFN